MNVDQEIRDLALDKAIHRQKSNTLKSTDEIIEEAKKFSDFIKGVN